MNLTGKTTIISAFPGIGKTTAAMFLRYDPSVEILDIDSGIYKAGYDKLPENIDESYVQHIIAMYYSRESARSVDPNAENTARVIFVSAHDKIRKLLSDYGMKFIYLFPTMESLPNVVACAEERAKAFADDGLDNMAQAAARASKFLQSDAAKASIQKSMAGEDDFVGQIETYAIPFGPTADNKFISVANFIKDNIHPSDDFLEANKISDLTAGSLFEILSEFEPDSIPSHISPIGSDGMPAEGRSCRGWYKQAGIDSEGRFVTIATPKNFWKKYRKYIGNIIPIQYMNYLGNVGLDSYVIKKDLLDQLLNYIDVAAVDSFVKQFSDERGNGFSSVEYKEIMDQILAITNGEIFPITRNIELGMPESPVRMRTKKDGDSTDEEDTADETAEE